MTKEQVKNWRRQAKMTQRAMGQALGVSCRSVQDWESGRRNAPPMLFLALTALSMGIRLGVTQGKKSD